MRFGQTLAALAALAGLQAPLVRPQVPVQTIRKRGLVNPAEVYREIKVAPGAGQAVKDLLLSFLDYQDLALYNPKFGYYASGRVSFTDDYQTFPNVLAPYFGQMVAEQILRMWDGMRRAETLTSTEPFTIAEFGAGNGMLAESILGYMDRQSERSSDPRWRAFAQQTVYACYDRSEAMRQAQQKRNTRFGTRFQSRQGDAIDPTATIAAESLKGVILSNELPDVFAVHKVILWPSGPAEVAFVAPAMSGAAWNAVKKYTPTAVQQLVASDDELMKKTFFRGQPNATVYLSRRAFIALLEALVPSDDYELRVRSIQFHEVYVPVNVFPELMEHLRRYAHAYALELAKRDKGVVTYINLGEEKFIRGAARILEAGYVMTVDYGANWDGVVAPVAFPHLRTYGPGNQREISSSNGESILDELAADINLDPSPDKTAGRESADALRGSAGMEFAAEAALGGVAMRKEDSDPYRSPTLNDITTDINFSYLAVEGRSVGLKTVFFGPQRALGSGTSVSVRAGVPGGWVASLTQKQFNSWAKDFLTNGAFKLLVQQMENTDASYIYPDKEPEPLDVNETGLSSAQRKRAVAIENHLRGAAAGSARF
jgi:SAM-dependent MidA family methyltransferase